MKRMILLGLSSLLIFTSCGNKSEETEQSQIEYDESYVSEVEAYDYSMVYEKGKSTDCLYIGAPQMFQQDFSDVAVGSSNIGVSGNLITSLCIIESAYTYEWITPDTFITKYSSIISGNGVVDVDNFGKQLLNDEEFSGEPFDFAKMCTSVKDSHNVLVKINHPSIYGSNIHYIVVTGVTIDGYLNCRDTDRNNVETISKYFADSGEVLYDLYSLSEAIGSSGTMYIF